MRKERKQHGYEDRGKSIPNSRRKSKEPTEHSQQQASQEHSQVKSIEDLEEDGKDSKSDTVKELVAQSKVESMPN